MLHKIFAVLIMILMTAPINPRTPPDLVERMDKVAVEDVIQWQLEAELVGRELDMSPALIMAVAVKESRGDRWAVGCDGEIGLMQIIPGSPVSKLPDHCPDDKKPRAIGGRPQASTLFNVYVNLSTGSALLKYTLENLADGNLHTALAYYNCGVGRPEQDLCGSYGGFNYADDIMDKWYPMVRKRLYGRPWERAFDRPHLIFPR